MTLLIVLACVGAYLVIGFAYGRSQAVAAYQRGLRRYYNLEVYARTTMRSGTLWRAVAWPVILPADLLRASVTDGKNAVCRWLDAPLDQRRTRAAELRAEASRYDALIVSCDDAHDRDLMRKGQQALRDQAAEVDL